jgi:hypothetical protein
LLGFDPTIQPVPGNRGQFVITVHPDNDKQTRRRFRTIRIISSSGAVPLRGRGTHVFEVVEIDGNGESSGPTVVLKDIWIDSDRTREGTILASLLAEANDEDKWLVRKHFLTHICHGDVWTEFDILDDTENALMRGLDTTQDHDSPFTLQQKSLTQTSAQASGSTGLQPPSLVQDKIKAPHLQPKYVHKTHYRIVFEEKGITISRLKSLSDVITILTETVIGAF